MAGLVYDAVSLSLPVAASAEGTVTASLSRLLAVDWRVLGPLEVWANGSPINLGGRQRRLVLAILLAHADQTVSTDRVVEEVWGGSPPDSARKTVQAHMAHLRRAINGASEFLSSSGDGYRVCPEAGGVDADRFKATVEAARDSADPARTVSLLDEALDMFRGEPYAGLADDALTVKVEASRLNELRLNATEERLEALLGTGYESVVAAETDSLLAEHPLRERLWAIHMLALYRSGRQSEALRAYSRARQILAEELGIEPSKELQALEQQILEQDASLSVSKLAATTASRTVDVRRIPYKGLRAFDEADSSDFFGRAELVRQLVDRVTARAPAPLTVIAGASGAGKSSVLRAGLLPVLRDRGLAVADMFPGEDPELKLDSAIREALSEAGLDQVDDRVDIVAVDQFEELFTQTAAHKTDRFIAAMTDASDPTLWVMTVRTDFLGDLLAHPELGRRLQEALVLVPPLEDHEVEAAIVEPARRVGVDVEPSLVATVVREVQSRASALPLMQYALTDLFERRRGDVLTLDAYERQGGLSGALVRRADQVFERLSPEGRDVARQIFLQLVTIADNGEFARRRVRRDNLHSDEPSLIDAILEQFGAQRLLTFDQDPTTGHATVELAHESLLEVWPRLSRWVDEAREELLMRSTLNTALAEWEGSDRDESFLLSGGRLVQHESWTADTDLALTESEIEYLVESRRDEDLALARRRRRRNWIMAGFAVAAAVATVFGVVALQKAEEADAAAAIALENARIARAEALAFASNDQLDVDPELSMLLALEAVETTRSVDGTVLPVAEEALHRAVLADRLLGSLTHNGEGIAHFSPDGRSFVTSSENMTIAQIWNVDPFEWRVDLVGHRGLVLDAVFDPAGERVAATGDDGTVRVWDAATGEQEAVLDPPGAAAPTIPVFSNDGSMLAAGRVAGTVQVWDLDTGDSMELASPRGTRFTLNLEFSPDDTLLLVSRETQSTADDIGPLLFDVATGVLIATLEGHTSDVKDVGFTPDGAQILTASLDGTVKIWDTETQELRGTFRGHRGPVIDLQISDDGTTVASSGDADVLVWDLATLQVTAEMFGHTGQVDGIDISPDGDVLLTSSNTDGTTRLWDLTPHWSHELIGLPGPDSFPGGLAYGPDGAQLAASRNSGLVTLWDPVNETELETFEVGAPVSALAFDAGGELLATAGEGGTAIWDLRTGEHVVLHNGPSNDIAFDPGGLLGAASSEGVRYWEPPLGGEGHFISTSGTLFAPGSSSVAFHPDREFMVTSGGFGIRVYGVDRGDFRRDLYPSTRPPLETYSISFHHEGGLLVSADSDWKVILWSAETFEPVRTLEGHTGLLDAVFHPTRPELATAGVDGTVKFWDVDTGRLRLSIPAPGSVSDLEYSPEGRYLAAIGEGFVTVYILDVDELVSEAETRLTRWWTETECNQYLDSETCPLPPEHLTTTTEAPTTTESESGESASSDLGGFSPFGAGTYTMVYPGIPVTFTVDENWSTQPVGSGFFVITTPDSRGPGDHDIVFLRPSAVYDADTREPSLSADDLDGWLATVPDTVSVSEPTPSTVAGFDAVAFEVTIDGGSVPLLVAGTGPDQFVKGISEGFLFEVLWIDLPDGPPIVIVLGTTQDDPGWLDIARDVVATLEMG